MLTATETLLKQDHQERYLQQAMEAFTMAWQPEDRRKAAEFHADLLRLIQSVHVDAARPFAELMKQVMYSAPLHSILGNFPPK